jgi:UDP-N-acetylmuramate: L-alanyl-gamma-D-glutamyl-meso-diaminopimelate ligase
MGSLAGLLKAQGFAVSGSDENVYPPMSTTLAELGIAVLPGYREEHLRPPPDLVIVGNAVSRDNPEVQATLRSGIPYLSFPQALGEFLIGSRRSIVVAGTHGKTTTSALMSWVLVTAGWNPSFFVGGVPLNLGAGFRSGDGDWVVLEGDEYDSAFFDKGPKFLHYRPERVILTSVEFDHADIYRDFDHLKEAFRRLIGIIPPTGSLIACSDYEAVPELAREARCPVVFYGDATADWNVANPRAKEGRSFFEPAYKGSPEGTIATPMIGRHNLKNALAVYVVARELGIDAKIIGEAMATFAGVRRRQEVKGETGGITVIDDFAHHPTAIRETIEAVRFAYPGRRIWAVFEPRSNTSRRRVFQAEFPAALAHADRIVLAGLYRPDKVPEGDRLSAEEVARDINRLTGDGRASVIERNDDIPRCVASQACPGDVVLVMSNGGFDGVQEKILEQLKK